MKIASFLTRSTFRQPAPGTKTPLISLENVRVASPCPMSWEQMAGDDRSRHCQECKLSVYNLSEMTRTEAERLIADREGRLCVRFYRRVDGTIITQDCPKGLRALRRRVSRVAGAALSFMIGLGTAFAQTAPQICPQKEKEQTAQQNAQLTFTLVDLSGAVIPGAKFQLTDRKGKVKFAGMTLSGGTGVISGVAPGSFVLRIERPGFQPYKSPITIWQRRDASNSDLIESERE